MQKFIDDLIQALYPAAELFLLLWYRAFALFYTLYGTLTHFTERLQRCSAQEMRLGPIFNMRAWHAYQHYSLFSILS